MLRNWRAWVLIVLFFGPIVAYIGLGAIWLGDQPGPLKIPHEWLYYATTVWILTGVAFSLLASRWTKANRELLPPIDWDAPETFTTFDRQAWNLVEEEANRSETISLDALSGFDVYMETGRRLANRIAAHYHPLSTDPLEHVPVVELLTALELAAEDLAELCREVPGGDLVTPAHWKKAVQAAGYLQKANEIYTYLLPVFQPVTGLMRLGSQKLMVQPAWKNMQENLLRWFFRAFVNRLGTHLIELNSGRLAIGAVQYRRLTRLRTKSVAPPEEQLGPLVIAVAGARGAGKSLLVEALERTRTGSLAAGRARLEEEGLGAELIERFKTAGFREVAGYTQNAEGESSRDRSTRRSAVEDAVEADLVLLMIDARLDTIAADRKFLEAWREWYKAHPGREAPPILAILADVDRGETASTNGTGASTSAAWARFEAVRAALPPEVPLVQITIGSEATAGVDDRLVPAIAAQLHRAERISLIRHFQSVSGRSTARRLLTQVGRRGRWLFDNLRPARKSKNADAT